MKLTIIAMTIVLIGVALYLLVDLIHRVVEQRKVEHMYGEPEACELWPCHYCPRWWCCDGKDPKTCPLDEGYVSDEEDFGGQV